MGVRVNQAQHQFLAEVYVSLKPAVNDPQGLEIRHGLHILGFDEVDSVRAGKYIQLLVRAESAEAAETRVREMSDRLLSNPVIEQYQISIIPLVKST
jgi:phosphoribosylformylglycinamidine synthase PurS subunit